MPRINNVGRRMSLRHSLRQADKQLAALHDECGERFDVAAAIVHEARELALKHGHPDAAMLARAGDQLSPSQGREILAAMLASLPESGIFNLEQAAEYLGYKPAGLRKMTKRGEIRHLQVGQGPLRFRREWLDEFIVNAPADKRRPSPPMPTPPVENRHGLDNSLLDI